MTAFEFLIFLGYSFLVSIMFALVDAILNIKVYGSFNGQVIHTAMRMIGGAGLYWLITN